MKIYDCQLKSRLEKQRKEKLMQDVNLLVSNLIAREETTVKLILDCLYEVGSSNLINQKISSRPVNEIFKLVAQTSKPIFRGLAWRWLNKNGSRLITDWLGSKVSFRQRGKPEVKNTELLVEKTNSEMNYLPVAKYQVQEVKYLRSQVKVLTAVLVGVVTLFSGGFVWLSYSLQRTHIENFTELKTQLKTLETSNSQP